MSNESKARVFLSLCLLPGVVVTVLNLTGAVEWGWEWVCLGPIGFFVLCFAVSWLTRFGQAVLELTGAIKIKADQDEVNRKLEKWYTEQTSDGWGEFDPRVEISDTDLCRMEKDIHDDDIEERRRQNWTFVKVNAFLLLVNLVVLLIANGHDWLKWTLLIGFWSFLLLMFLASIIDGISSSPSSPRRRPLLRKIPKDSTTGESNRNRHEVRPALEKLPDASFSANHQCLSPGAPKPTEQDIAYAAERAEDEKRKEADRIQQQQDRLQRDAAQAVKRKRQAVDTCKMAEERSAPTGDPPSTDSLLASIERLKQEIGRRRTNRKRLLDHLTKLEEKHVPPSITVQDPFDLALQNSFVKALRYQKLLLRTRQAQRAAEQAIERERQVENARKKAEDEAKKQARLRRDAEQAVERKREAEDACKKAEERSTPTGEPPSTASIRESIALLKQEIGRRRENLKKALEQLDKGSEQEGKIGKPSITVRHPFDTTSTATYAKALKYLRLLLRVRQAQRSGGIPKGFKAQEQERLQSDAEQAEERKYQAEIAQVKTEECINQPNIPPTEPSIYELLVRSIQEVGRRQANAEQEIEGERYVDGARNEAADDTQEKNHLASIQLQSALETATCERCIKEPRVAGERFCEECRQAVLAEMKQSGYLTRAPLYTGAWEKPRYRNQQEEMSKKLSPWQDNAIRALEGD